MPSKHVLRNFAENQCYHVFNRGVEKRNIFLDEQDYRMFLFYLFVYLAPLEKVLEKYPMLPPRLQAKNLSSELNFISYCLMPNHFHFLLRQKSKNAISRFMKQITNAYVLYFNKKYDRVGGLVQGRFKAVVIEKDELLLHISRYIHLNPLIAKLSKTLRGYEWSSYPAYIDNSKNIFCVNDAVLSQFRSPKDYEKFILDHKQYAEELDKIKHLILED